MRTLLLTLLLLAAMPVAAQNWVKIGETVDAVCFIDPGTIRVNGHLRRVSEVQELKQRDPAGEASRRWLNEYDCKEDRVRPSSLSTHSDPMTRGRTLLTNSGPGAWEYIASRTVGEAVLKIVCAVR